MLLCNRLVNNELTNCAVDVTKWLVVKNVSRLYNLFIKCVTYPYHVAVESKLINRAFSWRPYIDPISTASVSGHEQNIRNLTKKISSLNEVFHTGNFKGVLTPYELLLLLRCLEFWQKNEGIPAFIEELVDGLIKENLLKSNKKELRSSIFKKIINDLIVKIGDMPSACFRGNLLNMPVQLNNIWKFSNPLLFSSHFNSKEPQVSFSKQEWSLLLKIGGAGNKKMSKEEWLVFLNQLAAALKDPAFKLKLKTFHLLSDIEFFKIEQQLFNGYGITHLSGKNELADAVNGTSILLTVMYMVDARGGFAPYQSSVGANHLDQKELNAWIILLNHLFHGGNKLHFPSSEEAESSSLTDDAKKLLKVMPLAELPYWQGLDCVLKHHKNLKVFRDTIDKWKTLPQNPMEWTQADVELVRNHGIALARIFRMKVGEKSWLEAMSECPYPGIKETFDVYAKHKKYFDHLIAHEKLKRLKPIYCHDFETKPIKAIFEKVKKICSLSKNGELAKLAKRDKLTLGEYYWMKYTAEQFMIFSPELEEEFKYYLSELNAYPNKPFINICFYNIHHAIESSKAKEIQTNKCTSLGFKTILFLSHLFAKALPFGPTNVIYNNGKKISKIGISGEGVYYEMISNSMNIAMEAFNINTSHLGRKLHVPENQLPEFGEAFENHFVGILNTPYNVEVPNPITYLFLNLLTINPFLKPQDYKLENGQKMFCNEYVSRVFVQASCAALTDLDLPLPKKMSSFGFGMLDKKISLTPDKIYKTFIREGFLVPNRPVSAFVAI